jgi:hypothetical protein
MLIQLKSDFSALVSPRKGTFQVSGDQFRREVVWLLNLCPATFHDLWNAVLSVFLDRIRPRMSASECLRDSIERHPVKDRFFDL